MTTAPSGPTLTLCGTFDGIRHVPPGPSRRVSSPIVNVTSPVMTIPSCSFSWWCPGTIESGASSTSARVIRSPSIRRARTVSPHRSMTGIVATSLRLLMGSSSGLATR